MKRMNLGARFLHYISNKSFLQDSVVNKRNTNVKELSATWIPPRDYRGTIVFYLTVVPHGTQGYYLRVKSPRLHPVSLYSIIILLFCKAAKVFGIGPHRKRTSQWARKATAPQHWKIL